VRDICRDSLILPTQKGRAKQRDGLRAERPHRPREISASGVVLEGIFEKPKERLRSQRWWCVIRIPCTAENVQQRRLRDLSGPGPGVIATLRFNFRGVGRSRAIMRKALGSRDDVGAALDFLQSSDGVDKRRLGLAGYSFGTRVVMPVGCGIRGFVRWLWFRRSWRMPDCRD